MGAILEDSGLSGGRNDLRADRITSLSIFRPWKYLGLTSSAAFRFIGNLLGSWIGYVKCQESLFDYQLQYSLWIAGRRF